MWLLLSIIAVIIRVIVGSSDIENVNRVQAKLENVSQAVTSDRIQMYDSNLSRSPQTCHDTTIKENNVQKTIHKRSTEGENTDLWSSLQGSEILADDPSPYISLSERSLRSSVLDLSQEKKSSAFNPWGGKRVVPARSKSQRPFRMPFNSWGGKRAHGYSSDKAYLLIGKDSKPFLDKNAERNLHEYVKRQPNFGKSGRRIPFHSWGGKRSTEMEFDMDKGTESDNSEDKINLYLSEDAFTDDAIENNISESIESERSTAQTKADKLGLGFNNWERKGNNVRDYRSSLGDELSTLESAIEKNINVGDKLPVPGKRAIREYARKFYFQPWGGKQSTNTEVEIVPNNYAVRNAHPVKEKQIFFAWGG